MSAWRLFAVEAQDEEEEGGYRSVPPEFLVKEVLKVFTNEKKGGLTVVTFDRSHFKLFSRKFSNE